MTRNKKVFLLTCIIGILTHAFRMTNVMLNADATNYLKSIGVSWVISLGRFLLPVVEKIRGNYEVTWLIGVISIILIAFSAMLVAEILDIKGTVGLVILSAVMVANPVVTSTMAYMYTADGYMIGLFFAVLCAYAAEKWKKWKGWQGIVLGGLALTISLGFYQAFVSTTIILMMLILMAKLLDGNVKWNQIWTTVGRFALTGILGVGIYGIILKIVWTVGGFGTTSYMGMDSGEGFSAHMLSTAAIDTYIDFARYFIVRYQINCYNVMNVLFFICTASVLILVLTKRRLWKQVGRWVLVCALLLLLPFAGFIFEFASEGVSYTSTTMEYGVNLIYLIPIVFWQNVDTGAGEFREWVRPAYLKKKGFYVVTCLLLLCICFHFTVIANQAYRSMKNANTKLEMLINRMEMRMEMEDGYQEDMEVAVVGHCFQNPEYVYAAPMMSGVVSNIFLTQPDEYVSVMNWHLGTDYKVAGFGRTSELVHSEEFATMEEWPVDNSVKVIDGTMVLYLNGRDLDIYE